jgi:death-on-curing family protein
VKEPIWLRKDVLLAVHERLLSEHGGSAGIRDEGLLESALGRPQNLFAYEKPALFDLASAYAIGVIKNHPFVDGNKRTGFMAAYLFLGRNGYEFAAEESDVVVQTLAVAEGKVNEQKYAAWLRENSKPIGKRGK